MAKQVRLRPVARDWYRGPAWRDGAFIVMDGARAEPYQLLSDQTVGQALARVKTPDDAVEFVRRFGVLRSTLVASRDELPAQVREAYEDFATEAERLRWIIKTITDVRHAVDGDRDAMTRLRAEWVIPEDRVITTTTRTGVFKQKAGDVWSREQRLVDADDRTIQMKASDWATLGLNNGIIDAKPYVFDRAQMGEPAPPGHIRIGIQPNMLIEVCYLTVAMMLAEKEPVEICPECQRPFIVEDARQRYCVPACASRARFRRYSERLAAKKPARRSRGKTTRTR